MIDPFPSEIVNWSDHPTDPTTRSDENQDCLGSAVCQIQDSGVDLQRYRNAR
jgi:hypothetical protein